MRVAESPPHDQEAEAALLGAVMLGPSILPKLTSDLGLRPHHFFLEVHRDMFTAMTAVHDRGLAPDAVTVCNELEGAGRLEGRGRASRDYVHSLSALVPAAGNWPGYARTVLELAGYRQVRLGAFKILEGVERREYGLIDEGEAMLRREGLGERRTSAPDELAEELFAKLEGDEPEAFSWPFPRFDKLTMGGMRRGQLSIIAGWSSHGKSVFLDQCLESASGAGLRCHLFINEMSKLERTMRTVARLSSVGFERIARNRLDDPERRLVVQSLERIPFGITDCAGWSAMDVAREVRRNRYDIVGIDILNRFPGANDRQRLEEISARLNELAKPSQGNCHVLLAAHLNRNRAGQSVVLPFPSLADLRETGMLVNDADVVSFVYREQDQETGEPQVPGVIRFAKVRGGRPGGLPVRFDGDRMQFQAGLREAKAAA